MNVPTEDYAAQRGADPRIVALELGSVKIEARVATLETWKGYVDIADAKRGEREKATDTKLDRIDSTITFLNRLVMGAIVLAILTFALKGGFTTDRITLPAMGSSSSSAPARAQ